MDKQKSIFVVKANAKINLFLKVIKKSQSDNVHSIKTLMIPYKKLCDVLKIKINNNFLGRCFNTSLIRVVDSNNKKIKIKNNILYHVISVFKKIFKNRFSIYIKLVKNIPIGSGLGGSSSDAYMLWYFLCNYFDISLHIKNSLKIIKEFGSDVVFFYYNKPCIFSQYPFSISIIKNLKLDFKYNLLTPPANIEPILTKKIFENYQKSTDNSINLKKIMSVLKNKKALSTKYLFNDLSITINKTYPNLYKWYDQIKSPKLYTGSGGAVLIFTNKQIK